MAAGHLVDQRVFVQHVHRPSCCDFPVVGMNGRAANRPTSSLAETGGTGEADRVIGYGAFGVVWAVTDPRTSKRVALKKLLNVFHSVASCRRAYRELSMLFQLNHENVLSATDILLSTRADFGEIYIISELMQSDLHKIIVSAQPLSSDHIKLFTYQILRGLKYLHSANIIHRDIKPGNLFVNGDCHLKIGDFGLARVLEFDESTEMTQEVVTQYYRAPEILMGARHYDGAVDLWSVGCIIAELLSRHILFQAQSALQQLNLIIEVLGTPSVEDMVGTCEPAKQYVLQRPFCYPNMNVIRSLSHDCDNEVLHLLRHLLTFSPRKRISAVNALMHPYVEEGRIRYHACMCSCCPNALLSFSVQSIEDFEPVCQKPFQMNFEDRLSSKAEIKHKLAKLYRKVQTTNEISHIPQLHLNLASPFYQSFSESRCAQFSELPPSPYLWE